MNRKMLFAALLVCAAAAALPACNTVKGLGKDLHDSTQNVQEWVEQGSENHTEVQSVSR